jgi:hypothetical protein
MYVLSLHHLLSNFKLKFQVQAFTIENTLAGCLPIGIGSANTAWKTRATPPITQAS